MNDQELDSYCHDWAHWARTRRYFAPPVPPNIMASMVPSPLGREPDGPMSADISFFNMALQRVAEDNPAGAACFSLHYFYRAKNVRAIAERMNICQKTFYNRAHAFAKQALRWQSSVKRAHIAALHDSGPS